MEVEAVPFVVHLTAGELPARGRALHPVAEMAQPSVYGTTGRRLPV